MCVGPCFRYLVIIFDGLLTVGGMVLIGIASYALTLVDSSEGKYYSSVVIAVGCLILLSALCGCVGGLMQNFWLLITHSILMVLLTIFTTVMTVLLFMYKKKIATLLLIKLLAKFFCMFTEKCTTAETNVEILGYFYIGLICMEMIWVVIGIYVAINVYRGKKITAEYVRPDTAPPPCSTTAFDN